MVDIESQVFTKIATALRKEFTGIFVTGEYVRKQYSRGVGHTIWIGDSSEKTGIQINFTNGTVTAYKEGTATAL